MTHRELICELMRSKGFSDEEITIRQKAASMCVPGAPIDLEFPPEQLAVARQRMEAMFAFSQQCPEALERWLDEKSANHAKKN